MRNTFRFNHHFFRRTFSFQARKARLKWHFLQNPEHIVYGIIGANTAGIFPTGLIGSLCGLAVRRLLSPKIQGYFSYSIHDVKLSLFNPTSRVWQVPYPHHECLFTQGHLAYVFGLLTPDFGINMFVLYQFAVPVVSLLGPTRFMSFYLSSAVASNMGSYVYQKYLKPRLNPQKSYSSVFFGIPSNVNQYVPSLGASGCVSATSLLFGLNFRHHNIYLYGLVPIPALVAVGGYLLYDTYQAIRYQSLGVTRTNHAAHVSGALFGIAYYLARRIR